MHDVRIQQTKKEIGEVQRRMIEGGELRAKALKTKADANRERAVDVLIKKFEGEVGNAQT